MHNQYNQTASNKRNWCQIFWDTNMSKKKSKYGYVDSSELIFILTTKREAWQVDPRTTGLDLSKVFVKLFRVAL